MLAPGASPKEHFFFADESALQDIPPASDQEEGFEDSVSAADDAEVFAGDDEFCIIDDPGLGIVVRLFVK